MIDTVLEDDVAYAAKCPVTVRTIGTTSNSNSTPNSKELQGEIFLCAPPPTTNGMKSNSNATSQVHYTVILFMEGNQLRMEQHVTGDRVTYYQKEIYLDEQKLNGPNGNTRKSKKVVTQEAWNQTIITAVESAPPSLKAYMDQLVDFENVPQKEKQFRNFTVNSLRLNGSNGEKIKDDIWKLLAKVRDDDKKKREEQEQQRKESKQGANSENKDASSKKDSKSTTPMSDSDGELSVKDSKMDGAESKPANTALPSEKEVTKAAKRVLKKAPNNTLKFKSLRKQVQESLLLKSDSKEKLKKILKQCVETNPKKMVMDGKVVSLVK